MELLKMNSRISNSNITKPNQNKNKSNMGEEEERAPKPGPLSSKNIKVLEDKQVFVKLNKLETVPITNKPRRQQQQQQQQLRLVATLPAQRTKRGEKGMASTSREVDTMDISEVESAGKEVDAISIDSTTVSGFNTGDLVVPEDNGEYNFAVIRDNRELFAWEKGEPLPKRRKRGRPVSTGEYEILKAKRASDKIGKEGREEDEMVDPKFPLTGSQAWERMERRIEEFRDEALQAPVADIAAEALGAYTVIRKWAIKGHYQKGTTKKAISDAVCKLQAAVVTLASQVMELREEWTPGERGRENEAVIQTNRQLRAEILTLRNESKRLREMAKQKPPKRTHPPQANDKGDCSGTVKEVSRSLPAAQDNQTEAMNLDTWEAATAPPPPIIRPPVKGITKRLEEYPPEIKTEEDRKVYDELTSGIQALLGCRENLMKGIKTQTLNSPPSRPSPSPVNPIPSRKQYAEVLKAPAAPGNNGMSNKKETGRANISKAASRRLSSLPNGPPPVRRYAGATKAPVPAAGGEGASGKEKEKGNAPNNVKMSTNKGAVQPNKSANKRNARQSTKAVVRDVELPRSDSLHLQMPKHLGRRWGDAKRPKNQRL